ncbi:hypothetical protein RJ639_047610 [Escallonia herrerae]|uniref:Glycoside hydrolase family 19 catalytic domain-containing protein n=1 Tax=Escallonia herrerae TaxID=1293975 RepID=A0AA89AZ53_9ASTE|nr:hypothetical protein RJ639_047610 [Escallonia herrerae]
MAASSSSVSLLIYCSFCLLSFLALSSSLQTAASRRDGRSRISSLISQQLFDSLFLHKDDPACPANNFYTYASFLEASTSFPKFGNTGSQLRRRREVAAFLAQVSHETTGGWPTAPDGPFAWGLCFKEEVSPPRVITATPPTNNGLATPADLIKEEDLFSSRGILTLVTLVDSHLFYYPAGKALGFDGLRNPEIVSNNSLVAFKTALLVLDDRAKAQALLSQGHANRTVGYGMVTNIINGGLECGLPNDGQVNDRIGYFQRYANLFGVDTGHNLDFQYQKPFN